ncbi:hypothetical protein QFC22_000787 [Naganishia vaughanmartiniae]|uniref:Uncharacterized protein n=1 Tax=Naganishia vaughanmartiniae TaxID=1424756 RepID=A0ACC2XK55_9TREE|nr:hypothetical protein QFC22_000787 [Naganishia vaughanmartiniae]
MSMPTGTSSTRRRSQFRPCIDLHGGLVKQIVGGTLGTDDSKLQTNFVATQSPKEFAEMYRDNNLTGGHVIKLGPGNDDAAREALAAWPGGLQVGGGIQISNAQEWIDVGAEKVIVTSALFPKQKFSLEQLQAFSQTVGKDRLVVDVSCRKRGDKWIVAMNKWQDLTDMEVNRESISMLEQYCSELLIHAADVEGLCQGIDEELVQHLSDLELVDQLSKGKVDLTYGSSLDIFGGKTVKFDDLVKLSHRMRDD